MLRVYVCYLSWRLVSTQKVSQVSEFVNAVHSTEGDGNTVLPENLRNLPYEICTHCYVLDRIWPSLLVNVAPQSLSFTMGKTGTTAGKNWYNEFTCCLPQQCRSQ